LLKTCPQALAVLESTEKCTHYSLLRWLSASGKSDGNSRVSSPDPSASSSSAGASASASPPVPDQLSKLSSQELQALDDWQCDKAVRQRGFVRGVLLPVRNTLGDAARVGAVLQEGPGPYKVMRTQKEQQVGWLTHVKVDVWGCGKTSLLDQARSDM
jgi:hypothetical protein